MQLKADARGIGFAHYVNCHLSNAAEYVGSGATDPNFLKALDTCRVYVDEKRAAAGDS